MERCWGGVLRANCWLFGLLGFIAAQLYWLRQAHKKGQCILVVWCMLAMCKAILCF